jgi:hypothetical protein
MCCRKQLIKMLIKKATTYGHNISSVRIMFRRANCRTAFDCVMEAFSDGIEAR